jgi:hypothetical protein
MHDSRRYRDNAAECLLAAQEACELHCRKLHLSMADSWLSLARRDEAMDNLLASGTRPSPSKLTGLGLSSRSTNLLLGGPSFISRTVAHRRTRKVLVTHDPNRISERCVYRKIRLCNISDEDRRGQVAMS